MTLEEIKELLEKGQKQFETEKSNLLKQVPQLCDKFKNKSKELSKTSKDKISEGQEARGEILDELCKLQNEALQTSGIRNIEYNTEGEPTLIELCGDYTLPDDLFYFFSADSGFFMKYNEERLKKWPSNQDNLSSLYKISKELNTEELKKRGITNDEIGLFGDAKVREITFDSILKSGFFSQKDVDKARSWAEDINAFLKAIEEYVKKTTVLMPCKVTISSGLYGISMDKDFAYKEDYEEYYKDVKPLYYRVTDAENLDRLKKFLYWNNLYKSGREMIILLLLLDDMTPQEYRLKWRIGDNKVSWSYNNEVNTFFIDMLDFYSGDKEVILLHEIGHYLQTCFGLKQTFESYQNPFAEKLLLLQDDSKENKKTVSVPRPFPEENEKTVSVPRPLYNLFAIFDEEPSKEVESDEDYANKNIQKKFTEKDLFMRWQLVSRWNRGSEISNILGVYFDRNNIYINNFSEICFLKFSRYGHVEGRDTEREKLGDIAFDNPEHLTIFKDIVEKAKKLKPDQNLIKLLRKVNRVKPYEIIDLFGETIDRNKVDEPRMYDDRD
jgi:hypothetical protein